MGERPPEGARTAECPNCGAPIAFRLGSSRAAVCEYCRFSVVRTDRELSTIGKVSDLTPTAAPIAVDDEGSIRGRSFRVLGRTQLDHGRGPWDEWYVGFSDGSWGWLARAEGRWYLTFERPCARPPAWEALAPGERITLDGTGSLGWVVAERGGSALVSAEGELPFPVDPRGSGRYVDLEGDGGAFATLDYAEGEVRLFAGRELAADELTIRQTALGPRPTEQVAVARLACPECGAPIPLFVPEETERCGCAACGALLDHTRGTLKLLAQLGPPPVAPLVPLGTTGELLGERRTVIGFMQRHVDVEGERYAFREYLLHAASGYAFLVEENRHWLLVSPISASTVRDEGSFARHRGVRYRKFAVGHPVVDFVIGEFYWKVAQGDAAQTVDYLAPPHVLSMERTEREVTWSAGSYVDPALLARAFGLPTLPRPVGIGAAQPNPFGGGGATKVFLLLALAWLLLAFAYEIGGRDDPVLEISLPLSDAPSEARTNTSFSKPFEVRRGPTTLELALRSQLESGWVQLDASLIPESGGEPRELRVLLERYLGASDGERLVEGSHEAEGYLGEIPPGRYTLRLVSRWAPYPDSARVAPPVTTLHVTPGKRSAVCALATLALIALPWLLSFIRRQAFELRRREHESL